MKISFLKLLIFSVFISLASCGEGTDVVESGTYEGTIQEVEPEKTEIYVETKDGKTLELYFTEQTTLSRNGSEVDFSTLQEGQKVQVEVKKVGQRLDPISVTVLE